MRHTLAHLLLPLTLSACAGSLAYYGPKDEGPPTDDGIDTASPDTTDTTEPDTTDTTEPDTTEPDTDSDGDTDSDADSDGDTDSDTDGDSDSDTDADTGTARPWTDGDPSTPPPYTAPPAQNIGNDCTAAGGIVPDLDDDEVDVLSHEGTLEIRTLTSSVSGWYDLYDEELSHEEAGEWNESAMVRIINAGNPTGSPALGNCDGDWVAVDPDNYTDIADDLLYLGTFWFEVGANELQLEHLCPSVRAGSCADLEFLDDPDTTCAADDGNSALLDGERLCMVPSSP